jgi:molybdopterin-binding protein
MEVAIVEALAREKLSSSSSSCKLELKFGGGAKVVALLDSSSVSVASWMLASSIPSRDR